MELRKKFIEDINTFKKSSEKRVKSHYITLVKKYHPDGKDDSLNNFYNRALIMINTLYARLRESNKPNYKHRGIYSDYIIDGKYQFINRLGRIERTGELEYFIYKMGYDKIMEALDHFDYSLTSRDPEKREEVALSVSRTLYRAYNYFNDIIKLNSGSNWYYEAIDKLNWAYKINHRVTRHLSSNNRSLIINTRSL